MFILFVYLVSMNLLMIRTQENIVIYVNATDNLEGPHRCNVTNNVTLVKGSNVSLEVQSHYFIKHSHWIQTHMRHQQYQHRFHHLENSNFSITYERSISSNNEIMNKFTYKYSHTQKVVSRHSREMWKFTFELIRNYDPWMSNNQSKDFEAWFCQTSVQILDPSKHKDHKPSDIQISDEAKSSHVSREDWLIILVSLFGILLLLQTSVIIYGKARSRKSKKNNDEDPISPKSPKTKRGAKPRRNIADRPPLPLPDEVVKEDKFKMESKPSPMSPVPKRHNLPPSAPPMPVENPYNQNPGPLVPKQSYRNKGLDHSDEDITSPGFPRRRKEDLEPKQTYRNKQFDRSDEDLRSPGFPRRQMEGPHRNQALDNLHEELKSPGFPRRQEGPLVPKQSHNNKPLNTPEEELRTPGFARRQLEGKFAQLPPKAVTASKSFKVPKPLPRSPPSPPPEKAPAFHPVHRKEPVPPLHPKNMPVFPPPAPCRQTEPRLSDVDWQYEELQPASKYLNNFSNTPYNNM